VFNCVVCRVTPKKYTLPKFGLKVRGKRGEPPTPQHMSPVSTRQRHRESIAVTNRRIFNCVSVSFKNLTLGALRDDRSHAHTSSSFLPKSSPPRRRRCCCCCCPILASAACLPALHTAPERVGNGAQRIQKRTGPNCMLRDFTGSIHSRLHVACCIPLLLPPRRTCARLG